MTEKTDSANTLEQHPQQAVDEPLRVQVKSEKIDAEVEAKLRAIKSDCSPISTGTLTDSDSNDSLLEDKKQIEPVKSSNEILAELFGVFNVAPPDALLDDKNLLRKHKKPKKQKKKKSRGKQEKSDGECTDTDESSPKHKNKREKHKHKHKDGRDKHKDKDREKSKERRIGTVKHEEKSETTRKRHATATQADKAPVPAKKEAISIAERAREKERENDKERDRERERERDKEKEGEKERERERARGHNSFYNGCHDGKRPRSKEKNIKSTKVKPESRESDEISLSDEETFLREKANGRNNFYGNSSKPDPSESKRHNNPSARHTNSSTSRQRSRSRSRSRDLGIDKKRLLEIARRNAISMFKRGNMAGVAQMTPAVKDKVLLKMRYGGRSVQDLTNFCKKISNGDMLSDLSSDEDSDVDKNGNTKAFHHPFQLKEREPIVMHIRNATSIVPATRREEQTKAITMQFPVSSGQVHRMSEVWVPVDALAPLPALPPAKQSTNMFKDVQRNVFAKSLPQQEMQEPAFKPAPNLSDGDGTNDPDGCAAMTLLSPPPLPVPAPEEVIAAPAPTPVPPPPEPPAPFVPFVPEVPIPSTAARPPPAPRSSIFPQALPPGKDVSSIITQRLSAIRRLQDNPADSEAIKMMYNTQRDMTSWASSKYLPGQFTGSTGAHVMKVHELSSGPQLWARKDQLTSTKPVTGGMGMTLLQKMGWKPGEGLGRSKTGSLQPLQLKVKLDKRGLISREDIKHPSRSTGSRTSSKNTNASNIAQVTLTAQEKHPVCVLNELTSKNRWAPPQYTLRGASGPSHSRMFLFSVEINGESYMPAQSCNSKKEAKMNAAKLCLRALGILPPS